MTGALAPSNVAFDLGSSSELLGQRPCLLSVLCSIVVWQSRWPAHTSYSPWFDLGDGLLAVPTKATSVLAPQLVNVGLACGLPTGLGTQRRREYHLTSSLGYLHLCPKRGFSHQYP